LTFAHHLQTLNHFQLKCQKLDRKYKALHIKYNALKSAKSPSVKGQSSHISDDKEILLAGGWFAFAFELWVNATILNQERPSGMDPLSYHHYDSKLTERLTIITKLYNSLPSHLQAALRDPRQWKYFTKIVSSLNPTSLLLTTLCSS